MSKLNLIAAGALSLGLAAAAFATQAQPYGKGGNYVLAPPAQGAHQARLHEAKCGCSMMQGDTATRDQCMAMAGGHHGDASKPGQPG